MDNGQSAYDFFVNQGLGAPQAAGIVGNLQGESGQGLNPSAVNPGDGRDGSDSIGIGQWNGTRAQALKDYAASKNVPWNDLNTQLEFLHSELKGPESAAYTGLLAAKTPEQAGQAMLAYERPKDWNKPGAHPERGQYAARAMAAYGGGNAPAPSMQPMSLAPPSRPMFAQAPQQAAPQAQASAAPDVQAAAPSYQAPAIPATAPTFATPARKVDLSKLMAAFKGPNFYAKGST